MTPNTTIPKTLLSQIDLFIGEQSKKCISRMQEDVLIEKAKINFKWLTHFAYRHFESRITRANDLLSEEVISSQKLAREYIGENNHVFFATCVDGRNMPSIMFSKPPHVGGVLRTPAGIVSGFMLAQHPESVFIDTDSFVVKKIISLLREKSGSTIFYSLDSHVGCAARAQIHETEGGNQVDDGLRSDIINKMMTARGIIELQKSLVKRGENVAEIIPTFFTYDPRNGGVISGLELHINRDEIARDGFTDENIEKLSKNKLVIKSIDLIKDQKTASLLSAVVKPESADFRNNYPKSLMNNWNAITSLYDNGHGELFVHILDLMKSAYLGAGWKIADGVDMASNQISMKVLEHKAKFMLRNIVTRYSVAGSSDNWPYNNHREEMIVITDGGYAPFPSLDAFAVFSKDLNSLVINTKLTIDLLRLFRRSGKIKSPVTEVDLDKHGFESAPIFISNKAILKDLTEESFQNLINLDLGQAFNNIKWDDPDVLAWRKSDIAKLILSIVESKTIKVEMSGTLRFVDAVYELFDRMRILMKDKQFRQMLINGNIVIFNTIVDRNRLPKLVISMAI